MNAMTSAQLQINFDQALDIVKTGKPLTITQDGQPAAILFSFKDGSELLRLRHTARLDGYLAARLKNVPKSESELSMDEINKFLDGLRS